MKYLGNCVYCVWIIYMYVPVLVVISAPQPHVLSHHSVHSVFYVLSLHADFSSRHTSFSYWSRSRKKKVSGEKLIAS